MSKVAVLAIMGTAFVGCVVLSLWIALSKRNP